MEKIIDKTRLYCVEIPVIDYEEKAITEQRFYIEIDRTLEKNDVEKVLEELHKEEICCDSNDWIHYNGEWLDMLNTIRRVKEWPRVYEGLMMASHSC